MSEIRRYEHRPGSMILSEGWGDYVRWDDHWPEVERLKADIARLTAERDDARAELKRLTDDTFPVGFTESRPSDEDIWREAFFALWRPYYIHHTKQGYLNLADAVECMLAEYRKRWPK